jgi:hypothetical protein
MFSFLSFIIIFLIFFHDTKQQNNTGSLSTGQYPKSASIFVNVPPVPINCKLRTEDGRTVRIQETSMYESHEIWYRYLDPKLLGLDFCTGTTVSAMSFLYLGLQGIVNDRDANAVALGKLRVHAFMDHLYKENEYQYPAVGVPHKTVHDGTDLYAWLAKSLGYDARQERRAQKGSRVMSLPPSNVPYNLPKQMDAEPWEQVLLSYAYA